MIVTLLDGREVDSYSLEWLEETRQREIDARQVLAFPAIEGRRAYLAAYGRQHGDEARRRLEVVVRDLWSRRA